MFSMELDTVSPETDQLPKHSSEKTGLSFQICTQVKEEQCKQCKSSHFEKNDTNILQYKIFKNIWCHLCGTVFEHR